MEFFTFGPSQTKLDIEKMTCQLFHFHVIFMVVSEPETVIRGRTDLCLPLLSPGILTTPHLPSEVVSCLISSPTISSPTCFKVPKSIPRFFSLYLPNHPQLCAGAMVKPLTKASSKKSRSMVFSQPTIRRLQESLRLSYHRLGKFFRCLYPWLSYFSNTMSDGWDLRSLGLTPGMIFIH